MSGASSETPPARIPGRREGASCLLLLLTGGAFNLAPAEFGTLDRALRRLPASLDATDVAVEERRVVRKALADLNTIAAVYLARRAARMSPVDSLRHE
jgi:ABC-type lipoprotein release transport system permease subunit